MHRLINGAVHFHKNEYREHELLFQQLSEKQKPHTLFITCSDSRLVPGMITHTRPGDLFIIRNIANLVPPAELASRFPSTAAAIEYAVQGLEVENIVVCGHSNCGGCGTLYTDGDHTKPGELTERWMSLASHVAEMVMAKPEAENPGIRAWMTEQINVLEQIKHLLTYSYIRQRYQEGSLTIRGWYYRIDTGEVFQYDEMSESFELLN